MNKMYIDLSKAGFRTLHKERLVRRPVQVHGKDGKVHTRMQWVNPNDLQTLDKDKAPKATEEVKKPTKSPTIDLNIKVKPPKEHKEQHNIQHTIVESSKKKVYDTTTQKGYIDKQVSEMDKDEKQRLIDKYKLSWKHNEHSSIDWKNAVMALKNYLYEHPDVMGVGHLPKTNEGTPRTLEGTDKINDFCNKIGEADKYQLMKKLGICDGIDPRTIPEYASKKQGGNGTGFIMHMKNMMKLKEYLKENPKVMDDTSMKAKITNIPGSKSTSKAPSPAQKGGNTIEGILKTIGDKEKYDLMREHGIADDDPRLNPLWGSKKNGGDGTGFIRHMRNMMALKKLIETNPDILVHTSEGELSEGEKERLDKMNEHQKFVQGVKDLVANMSKDLKLNLIDELQDTPEFKERYISDNPNIDYMKSVEALRKYMENHPKEINKFREHLEKEQLLNFHIGNKELEKILRNVVGLTSKNIDYVKIVEKGKEWSFGISSFATIDEDDSGTPILSIVDTGMDGTDWNEYVYPMSEIKMFLQGVRDKSDSLTSPKATLIPLHKRGITEIEKELSKDYKLNYTDKVGDLMKSQISGYWKITQGSNSIKDLVTQSNKLNKDTLVNLLNEWDVPTDGNTFDIENDNWKSIAYADILQHTKVGNATDLLIPRMEKDPLSKKKITKIDTFPLIESAKNWTPKERQQARYDLTNHSLSIDLETELPDSDLRRDKLTSFIRESTDFIPFELFTNLLSAGLKIKVRKYSDKGSENNSCYYNIDTNEVNLAYSYATCDNLLSKNSAINITPEGQHPLSDSVSHEIAHAIDSYFSGLNTFLSWNNDIAKKYVGNNTNAVRDSYNACIERSNPRKEVIRLDYEATGGEAVTYYFHKDEWINSYEGRIYDTGYNSFVKDSKTGNYIDTRQYPHPQDSVEHWSDNCARFSNAFLAYKSWIKQNPKQRGITTIDVWAEDMAKKYSSRKLGDDWSHEQDPNIMSYTMGKTDVKTYKNRENHPVETHGYLLHTMKNRYPKLYKCLNHIFNVPDFVSQHNDIKYPNRTQSFNQGDFVRRSEHLYVLEGK